MQIVSSGSITKPDNRHRARTAKRAHREFTAVDGEGMAVECYECDCKLFTPAENYAQTIIDASVTRMCICGHYEISPPTHIGKGHAHNYVLLSVGEESLVSNNLRSLGWEEIFEFLYSQYDPYKIFVGYFLGYDFDEWFKGIPASKAESLLTQNGIKKRKREGSARTFYMPVVLVGSKATWEIHMHADRRFMLRPRICGHRSDKWCGRQCAKNKAPDMHIMDVGGFYQSSFLSAVDPGPKKPNGEYKNWKVPILSDTELAILRAGKERRSSAVLDSEMIAYNVLENNLLARLMDATRIGLEENGIFLDNKSWYGPGQVASQWLKMQNAPSMNGKSKKVQNEPTCDCGECAACLTGEYGYHTEIIEKGLIDIIPHSYLNAARETYIGGWFEIMCHGYVPGISFSYDINSAYPYIIKDLPCLIHGDYKEVKYDTPLNELPESNGYQIVRASLWGSDPYIGVASWRDDDGKIFRPLSGQGYYWAHEIRASANAGLIDKIEVYECYTYIPCSCPAPFAAIEQLYEYRRTTAGKNTAAGKSAKLGYNSIYGKFAQSIGDPPYANPIYASLITAGCRIQILEAIASHPGKPNGNGGYVKGTEKSAAVLMVATDGVYFRWQHPELQKQLSNILGEWEETEHEDLILFKPGMYWDKPAIINLEKGELPECKARGVSMRDFVSVIKEFTDEFKSWDGRFPKTKDEWPHSNIHLGFAMISCSQALAWTISKRMGGNLGDKPISLFGGAVNKKREIQKIIEEGEFKFSGLAGKVSEEYREHTAYPDSKRDVNGYYDKVADVYRSRPRRLKDQHDGRALISQAYSRVFSLRAMYEDGTFNPNNYFITPDGKLEDLQYKALMAANRG